MKTSKIKHSPVGYCIYCGTTQGKLTEEHIIPEGLGGIATLPESTCESCAKITSKFEQTVARFIYGNYRIKQDYPSKRKKQKKRPKELPVITIDNSEQEEEVHVSISDYPNTYLAVELPPPGLLRGIAPSNRSPELKLSLRGTVASVNQTMNALSTDQLILKYGFKWADFLMQLAKIAHCFTFCCTRGKGYEPLLADVILGKSHHLSHYVGGMSKDSLSEDIGTSDLCLSLVENNSEYFLVVGIHLLGVGTLPPYEVITGRVSDLHVFYAALTESNAVIC